LISIQLDTIFYSTVLYARNETRTTYQSVGVQEDALGELGQSPAVQLGEGHAEVRSGQEGKVCGVVAVEDVDERDDIEEFFEECTSNS